MLTSCYGMPRIIPAVDRLAWLQYLPMPTVYIHQVHVDEGYTSSIPDHEPTAGCGPEWDFVLMLVVDVPGHLHKITDGAHKRTEIQSLYSGRVVDQKRPTKG